jgi:hypothetical protein
MTFWWVVIAGFILMIGYPYWACLALYLAFVTISHTETDDTETHDPKRETIVEDIDNTG